MRAVGRLAHCCTIFLKSSGYRNMMIDIEIQISISERSSGWAINYGQAGKRHQWKRRRERDGNGYHEAKAKIFEMASNCFYRQPEVDNTGLDFIRLTLYVTNWNQLKVCKTCKMAIGCKTLWTDDFLTGI